MQSAKDSQRYFTYGDYRRWNDDQRWELIDGKPYNMSPAPSRSHQDWTGALYRQIADFLDGMPCQVYIAPFDVRLAERDEADDDVPTVVQPDISVICDRAKLDDAGCRGAPDWIVEVLSPGTASKDQTVKKALYERHGVNEYWLVHPIDHVLTRYWLDESRYGAAQIDAIAGTTPVRTLSGLSIDWRFAEPEPDPNPPRHP